MVGQGHRGGADGGRRTTARMGSGIFSRPIHLGGPIHLRSKLNPVNAGHANNYRFNKLKSLLVGGCSRTPGACLVAPRDGIAVGCEPTCEREARNRRRGHRHVRLPGGFGLDGVPRSECRGSGGCDGQRGSGVAGVTVFVVGKFNCEGCAEELDKKS